MVGEIARLPLAFQPGTRWNYGVGIDVAGHLAELISGQPLDQLLRERIFGPLGMHDTGYMVPPGQHSRLAAMYGIQSVDGRSETARLDLSKDHPTNDPRHIRGGHGLYSTARDYMRFAQMLLNRGELDGARILGRKTHALMHMNHLPPHILHEGARSMVRGGWGYGLGSAVMIDVAASGTIGSLGEYGWDGAAKTYYWVDPQEQLVGLLMTQYLGALDAPDQDLRVLAYQALVD
jgi:CubicO group peptidase (beta-lactamase class C family)